MVDVRSASAVAKFTAVSTFAGGGGSSTGIRLAGGKVALGGYERMLNVEERLKADYRAGNPKPINGAQGRRG
jgi:DNA (cytosine-5)-methyltransferase 1